MNYDKWLEAPYHREDKEPDEDEAYERIRDEEIKKEIREELKNADSN